MDAIDNAIKLYYNTEREKLQMPEYGRIVLNMVEQVKAIPDRKKRSEQAKAVVRVMELLNPQVHTQDNYEQKLWDHLYMIAGYDLDIDSPFPAPHPEAMDVPPMKIPINKTPVRANHYGRNIESIIDLIAGEPEGETKRAMLRSLAIYMRQQYLIWNKDSVADETIFADNALTNVVDILSMIPYIVPGTVLGIALLIGFNKPPLLISGTMLIMVVALIIRRLPYTIRSSVAILQQIPMSIEEAAISLGASKMKAFFRITVPMMASGIISGAILSWVTMISELSTAIILYTGKTKTLTVAIYTEVIRGNYGTAAALSTIMTILTVISLLAFSKLNGGKDISL